MSEIKAGQDTTEYKETKSAGIWGVVGMVLGVFLAVGAPLIERLSDAQAVGELAQDGGGQSIAYVILGGLLAIASVLYKMLVTLGYIRSRTDVKLAEQMSKEPIAGEDDDHGVGRR